MVVGLARRRPGFFFRTQHSHHLWALLCLVWLPGWKDPCLWGGSPSPGADTPVLPPLPGHFLALWLGLWMGAH